MAAALFTVNRGLSAIQVGLTGEIIFSTGLLDLMAVHPVHEKKTWRDPWAAIEKVSRDIPKHPYARMDREDIEAAFEEVLSFLQAEGLPYMREKGSNSEIITPLGTIKQTYAVPKTMWPGVEALKKKDSCLIVDFEGLNDFRANQIVAALGKNWPSVQAARIPFPGANKAKELFAGEIMAQRLELSENRAELIRALKPLAKDAKAVGMPAILGIQKPQDILSEIAEGIGVPVFEIPTLPVSVPGLRLNEIFNRGLSRKGVEVFHQHRVLEAREGPQNSFMLGIGTNTVKHTIKSRAVILATGRFWGRGLHADRFGIREAIFDLPVYQPEYRKEWHRKDFLDQRGHPANRSGLEVDRTFRPLDKTGQPAHETLYAAGSILAHQDWMRMKCGSGLAIATAYAAVNASTKSL